MMAGVECLMRRLVLWRSEQREASSHSMTASPGYRKRFIFLFGFGLAVLKLAADTLNLRKLTKQVSLAAWPIVVTPLVAATADPWNAKDLVLPISFGLPEGRYARAKRFQQLNKTRDFAQIIPGVKRTYIYSTEDSFYDGYAEAYYGITMKKMGWDCFRHYEIIASGSMPFFLDYSQIPSNTIHDFPVNTMKQAMELPGVPSQEEVRKHMAKNSTARLRIDHSVFNQAKYESLLAELIEYALDHLTWSGKAQYILSTIQRFYPCLTQPKVLMVTSRRCEFMSCVVFGALYGELGANYMSSLFGPKDALFESLVAPPKEMYGQGFSYVNSFSDKWNETEMDKLTRQRLQDGFFNTIVFTNAGNHYCQLREYFSNMPSDINLLYDYQREFNPLVIVVDGSDSRGCHKFFQGEAYPLEYHLHFIREYDDARADDDSLPVRWTGCD
jgi:hypothetical protein